MGDVDPSDAKLYAYLAERHSMKWITNVAFALIGRALLNSCIVYSEDTSDQPKLTRYIFLVKVVGGLVGDFRAMKVVRKRRSKAQIDLTGAQPAAGLQPPAVLFEQ